MKYEAQGNQIKQLLQQAKQILVVMAANADVDAIAAGLALFLSLKQAQKDVAIATESTMLVGHTNLFGVGDVKDGMPQAGGGNLILTLGGVAENGTAPALQRLDYSTTGSDLNLIFHVLPGKEFKPTFIAPKHEGNFDLIFVLGSNDLSNLGKIYTENQPTFQGAQLINIDKTSTNALYGQVNLVDDNSSSISEMVATILFDLQLPVDGDIASNILNGIYAGTQNLQNGGADTFSVIAESMKRGGKRSDQGGQPAQPVVQEPVAPVQVQPVTPAQPTEDQFNQLFGAPQPAAPVQPEPIAQPAQPIGGASHEHQPESQPAPQDNQASPDEAVSGEGVVGGEAAINPEPDWLTPKVYRSGNMG